MKMDLGLAIALILIALVLGLAIGYFVCKMLNNKKAEKEAVEASKNLDAANRRAEEIINNATIQAKNLTIELKQQAELEAKEKKAELAAQENKLSQREANIDRRDASLVDREKNLDNKIDECNTRLKNIENKEKEIQAKADSIDGELQKVAAMTTQEARDIVLEKTESKMSIEIATMIKQKEDEAKEQCDAKAKEILSLAISKYSQEVVTEKTVSVVAIPIDDTPEVIQVSCFDPIRREIARLSLEYLIKDGRIQPGRIEEIVEKARNEVNQSCHEAGINAAFKLGLPRINKELLDYVGRLKYRTSFTQNALDHSIQVAYLAGIMAAELGLDQNLARRAGLLHDIGKAADFEMDGSHVEIGARLAKKYGEPDVVINAIESHHGDVEAKYVISSLVQAADTLSAARPGARNETLENYIQRIEKLEEITKQFEGVQSSFAMQSGRELRIMVVPEKISDVETFKLARDIKEKIENEMTYPGQIKVSVIRETRATEVAK